MIEFLVNKYFAYNDDRNISFAGGSTQLALNTFKHI